MTFLIDNPNRRYKQYTYPRRGGGYTAPQIVLHTYEAPYTRSLLAAATWLTTRSTPGSYHALAGARSTKDVLQLAPWSYETWHSVPSNNWSIGISAVAQAHMWNRIPKQARENLVKSMAYAAANAAKWLEKHHGRVVKPRLLTRAQAMRKESGFVYHATMDPGRRTDPGKDFPWSMFINEFNRLMRSNGGGSAPAPTPKKDWFDMATEQELRKIIREEVPSLPWSFIHNSEDYNMGFLLRRTFHQQAAVLGNQAGLLKAIEQLAGGQSIDLDAVKAAAEKGVADALASIEADVTLTLARDDEETV